MKKEDRQEARNQLSRDLPDDAVKQLLSAEVITYLGGDVPRGLGPEVAGLLAEDGALRERHEGARAMRRGGVADEPAPQPRGGHRPESAGSPHDVAAVGIPGIAYPGPSRAVITPPSLAAKSSEAPTSAASPKVPTGLGSADDVVHRGELETECHDGIWYVRLYTTVPAMAATVRGLEQETLFKDVQQDAETGKIVVYTGANRMLWVSGGRMLRAAKWAAKYLDSKEDSATQAEKSATEERDRAKAAVPPDQKELHRNKAQAYTDAARDLRREQTPVIRSYLLPLETFNAISKKSITEAMVKQKGAEGRSFNVDRHAEPNQFGVTGSDLDALRGNIKPGSLVTYAYDLGYAGRGGTSGEVRPIQQLWERLGVPSALLAKSPWVEKGSFQDRKKLATIADDLNAHYVTWLQTLDDPDFESGGLFKTAFVEIQADGGFE